jgi:hypothetical protein
MVPLRQLGQIKRHAWQGNCNTATCKTAYWSGAPLNDFNDDTDLLVRQLKLKKSPVNWSSQADAR